MKAVLGKTYPDLKYSEISINVKDASGYPVRVMLSDLSLALHNSPYIVGCTIFIDDDIEYALNEMEYPIDKAKENGLYDELCNTVRSMVDDSSSVFDQLTNIIYAEELHGKRSTEN